ncbi:MAG: ABC transporter permease, partial [Planctomycetota bacterium]
LFSLPIRREAVLWGKGISLFVIGSIQLIVFFVYGELVFRVGLFQQPLTLAVLIVTWVAVAASFAMMLATTCRSAKQAEGLATILILVMSALGGCWFPTQLMSLPGWLESATRIVPTYWAMTGFQGMMWNQLTLGSPKVLGAISIQWLFVALLSAFSVIMFRRNYCRDLA